MHYPLIHLLFVSCGERLRHSRGFCLSITSSHTPSNALTSMHPPPPSPSFISCSPFVSRGKRLRHPRSLCLPRARRTRPSEPTRPVGLSLQTRSGQVTGVNNSYSLQRTLSITHSSLHTRHHILSLLTSGDVPPNEK